MQRTARKIFGRFAAFMLFFALLFGMCAGGVSARVYADTGGELNYDNTNVLNDLQSATVNGEPFDLAAYPRNPFGTPQVVTFAEYCYSQYENGNGNYALYVYVYNPALTEFSFLSQRNKIEMSSGFYVAGEEGQIGSVKDYTKFPLKFCNASTGEYANRFLKFRIVDDAGILLQAEREREQGTGSRYYHISGIELFTLGGDVTTANDYWVNQYYQFSGYAEGYGDSERFPLQCDATGNAEAVRLDVKHTYYRTESSGLGADHQNQLDTVYFAIPKRLFDTYGKLQRIKAEWYEYKTKEIVVTSNDAFYNAAQNYLGQIVPSSNGKMDTIEPVLNDDIGYALANGMKTTSAWGSETFESAKWGWNLGVALGIDDICDRLMLLFLTDNIDEYDPYSTKNEGTIKGNDLYDRILAYNKSYETGTLPVKDGTISADLFESDIDDSRKVDSEQGKIQQGYSYYDFDADTDIQKLISWQDGAPSFWENWNEFGFWDALFGNIPSETGREISPIQLLKESDLSGTDAEVSQRLLVNINDIPVLKDAYDDAVTVNPLEPDDEECYLVMFRFATSDYYAAPLDIYESDFGGTVHRGQAYVARQSVFFDFDVIDLTFNKEGVYTVIPAVSDPIDIVNDLTSPTDMGDDGLDILALIVLMLVLIILLVALMPILPFIGKGIVWLVCLPFRAFGALFKFVGKAKQKRRERKNERKNE